MASLTRRAMSLAQIPSVRGAASIGQRRGLAGAADHHGSTKVDFWKQPTNPGNWKEEHWIQALHRRERREACGGYAMNEFQSEKKTFHDGESFHSRAIYFPFQHLVTGLVSSKPAN
ncbi:LOW QUALITY PROTEIN: uncharacterized protein LOC18025570 [Eutrema salsugineum]|uniref:LOW QUALITY PROTEIN: uncharacterized protein LOC18025570 n=1 Tax=Eutrema salsugineum TaxID=72664 RepID=UPI000CED7D9C|nr:LOW QUALITY PROTEIN: uncharacterized protein LOC18025570 [Eutrema salsugineum]